MTDHTPDDVFDRQIRDFLSLEAAGAAGAPSTSEITARITSRAATRSVGLRLAPQVIWVVLAGLMLAALIGAALVGATLLRPRPLGEPTNGWIAFSTQPGWPQVGHDSNGSGGDIYLVREGVEPNRIVTRGPNQASNVCPAFSPSGRQLVYGERAGSQRYLVFLEVSADGSVSENGRLRVDGPGPAPCPRWSSDGSRVAYLEGDSLEFVELRPATHVVVRGLDGRILAPRPEDPSVDGLRLSPFDAPPLPSPAGDWVVLTDARGVVIAREDGSESRILMSLEQTGALTGYPTGFPIEPYAIPAWSPDGKSVLAMVDVSSDAFSMLAISVESPFEAVVLVSMVKVNSTSASSFPGRGDVSWQLVTPSDP